MKKSLLFTAWGGFYIVCAGLGFIPEPAGGLRFLLSFLSLMFFLPGAALVWCAIREKDRKVLLLVRNFSALSLALTLALLALTFLTALSMPSVSTVLSYMLIIVSSPMMCSGYWALSLFLWACLLMASLKGLRNMKN